VLIHVNRIFLVRALLRPRTRASEGYLIAVAAVTAAYLARLALGPVLGGHAPFLLFVLPVVGSVIYGGRSAGLVAGALSLIGGYSFVEPQDRWSAMVTIQAALFVLVCGAIGWIGAQLAHQQRISQQLKREAEDEASRAVAAGEQLRLLLEGASGYAIFMLDPDGNVSTWNSGAESIFGWAEEEMIGSPYAMLQTEDSPKVERAGAALARVSLEGRTSEELWLARKDGSEFLADVTITALRGDERGLRGFALVVHDATERQAAQTALERRERHLQSILDTVPDAMIVIDKGGIIVSFSATAERLFGRRERDVVGRNVSILMPNPDRERHDGYIERYLETGVPRIVGIGRIVTGLRADGSTFPMKLSVGETVIEDQRLFTGFVQDLTEKQYFEARVEQLRSELIHVSRLSAMGTMASTLAHELNQPLTAISSYGEAAATLLQDGEQVDRETLREIVADMAVQAQRAGGIVRRLREFVSRGEVNKTIEDLPKAISEASALALVGSREKGLVSDFQYDPDATPALIDRVQVQQVLMNLMRNAIEAMEQCESRRLSVRTGLLDEKTIEICVSDTGPGIAPQMREKLFEAFSSSKEDGMGLGLSICRTIIEAHGGRIAAEPAPGGGTIFRFTVPRAAEIG
jgi:two-component system sensor kinase FixL